MDNTTQQTLIDQLCREKNCALEEANQVIELLGIVPERSITQLKKKVFEIWEAHFGHKSRNFGLSKLEFEHLANQLRAGDQTLFERIFLRQFGDSMAYLKYHWDAPQSLAYDVTMDTLLRFRQSVVDNKINYGNLRFLFTRIAVWTLQKRRAKQTPLPLEAAQYMAEPEEEGIDPESAQIFAAAWKELGEACKELLGRFYYDNQPWREIAAVLQITEDNVRKKAQRCKETLKNLVKQRSD